MQSSCLYVFCCYILCLTAIVIMALLRWWSNLLSNVYIALFLRQDSRITDAANEAKDNLKYLTTLDKFFSPLSRSDPVT